MKKTHEAIRFLNEAEATAKKLGLSLGKGFVWSAVLVDGRDDACVVLWEATNLDDEGLLYAVFFIWRDRERKIQSLRTVFGHKTVIDVQIKSARQVGESILVEIDPPSGTLMYPIKELNIKGLLS